MYPTSDGKPVTDLQQERCRDARRRRAAEDCPVRARAVGGARPQTTAAGAIDDERDAARLPIRGPACIVLFLDPRFVDVEGAVEDQAPLIDALNKLIAGDDLIAVMTPDMSARGLTFTRRTGSIEQMLSGLWGTKGWIGTTRSAGGAVRSVLRPADHRRRIVDGARDDCPPPRDAARSTHSTSSSSICGVSAKNERPSSR